MRTHHRLILGVLFLALPPRGGDAMPRVETEEEPRVQVARPDPVACDESVWRRQGRLPPLLGKKKIVRGSKLIVDFDLRQVSPSARHEGRGGNIGSGGWRVFNGCSDDPRGNGIAPGTRTLDVDSELLIEVTTVDPAGKSGRGWPGVRCGLRLSDPEQPSRYLDVPASAVPAFNQPTGVVRDGDQIYLLLQFNGYASEIKGRGNLVLAGDLCRHQIVWRSADLASNAPLLRVGEYLITGYGFTREKDWLFVLDRRTGRTVQKLSLPKSPDALRATDDQLFVRLYDGYAVFSIK